MSPGACPRRPGRHGRSGERALHQPRKPLGNRHQARKGQLAIDDDLPHQIERNRDLTLLPILAEHVWGVRRLPRLHGDPFDQLLVVQAMQEDMTLVTHDRKIGAYGVPIIAA